MQLAQMLIPMVSAFAITIMFMPLFIGYMRYKKEGQVIREEGPSWHEKKSGTPNDGWLDIHCCDHHLGYLGQHLAAPTNAECLDFLIYFGSLWLVRIL